MRRRILLAMVAIVAAAVTAFAVPLALSAQDNVRASEVAELGQQATRLIGALPARGIDDVRPVTFAKGAVGTTASVYDRRGARLAGIGPQRANDTVRSALHGRVSDDHTGTELEVAVPVHDERQVVGAIRVAEPWSDVTGAAHQRWLAELLVAATVLVGASLAAALISRRLTAPIEDLVRVAVELRDGDLAARVEHSGVPELDAAGDALNDTAEELGKLIENERNFTADVAHQLNTPITALRLSLESALLTGGATTPALETAIADVDRLQATVDTLLAVARGSARTATTDDVASVVRDVVAHDAIVRRLGNRRIVVDAGVGIPPVQTSVMVVQEILAVLIDNAIVHGAGRIDVSIRRRGDGATVSVTDQGTGIRTENIPDAFDHADDNGRRLGLALARRLAAAHGLRLELSRARPHPTFTLALPGASEGETSLDDRFVDA
ncbi:MAG TPA: HAMP domain-containing sensor histidine kinase [Acidimicrobiales bacterium]|nr:HAMP domain-containing sensor histidine kinase [Acidimicrobiales bacterium]